MSPLSTDSDVTNVPISDISQDTQSADNEDFQNRRCQAPDRRKLNRRVSDKVSSTQPRQEKDTWDKIAAVAPIISGFLIFIAGGVFTYAFNQQQLKLQEVQTIERFIPHLMGSEQSKKAAILAISSLTNATLAGKIASVFASSGTVSALQSMATTGSEKEKSIATKALSDALENLAARESKLSDIESAYKEALKGDAAMGAQTPGTVSSGSPNLSKLADLYSQRGQLAMAEALYKRIVADQERNLGAENPLVADTLKSLAAVYQSEGKKHNADECLGRAREIESKALPVPKPQEPQAAARENPSEQERVKAEGEADNNTQPADAAKAAEPN